MFGFEPMPMVSKMEIKYFKENATSADYSYVDYADVPNYGFTPVQQTISSSKTYAVMNSWTNQIKYTEEYQIALILKVLPASFYD